MAVCSLASAQQAHHTPRCRQQYGAGGRGGSQSEASRAVGEGRSKRRWNAHALHGSLIIRSRHPEASSRFAWPLAPQVMTPTLALSVLADQYLSWYDRIKFMRSLHGAGQWTRTMAALLHVTVYCSQILIIKCKWLQEFVAICHQADSSVLGCSLYSGMQTGVLVGGRVIAVTWQEICCCLCETKNKDKCAGWLHSTALHCTALCRRTAALYSTALCRRTAAQHRIALHSTAKNSTALHSRAPCLRTAAQHSTAQHCAAERQHSTE